MANKIKLGDTVRSAIEVELWGDLDAETNDFPMLAAYYNDKNGVLTLPAILSDSRQLRDELTDMANAFDATAERHTADKHERTFARLASTMLARLSSAVTKHEKDLRSRK